MSADRFRYQQFRIWKEGNVFMGECLWPRCGERVRSDVSETQFNWQIAEHMASHTHQKRGWRPYQKSEYEREAK